MTTSTKTTRVVHFEHHVEYVGDGGTVENAAAVFANRDDSGVPQTIVRLDTPAWRGLGEPRQLLVTVEPADTLLDAFAADWFDALAEEER